jgi:hypothetical protein
VAGVVDCKSALETFGDIAERFDADLRHGILSVRVMRSDLKTNGKHTRLIHNARFDPRFNPTFFQRI